MSVGQRVRFLARLSNAHPLELTVGVRTGAHPLTARKTLSLGLIKLRKPFANELDTSPAANLVLKLLLPAFTRLAPRKISRPGKARKRPVDHERRDTIGMRCCKQQRHRSSLGDPDNSRTRRPSRIHHGPNIVNTRLEIRHPHRIRSARTTLIEDDQTTGS